MTDLQTMYSTTVVLVRGADSFFYRLAYHDDQQHSVPLDSLITYSSVNMIGISQLTTTERCTRPGGSPIGASRQHRVTGS